MALYGKMMDRPLLVSAILEHGADQFGQQEIVSRETHGPLHRITFAEVAQRSKKLANALAKLGLKPGSVVGSIAWNNARHVELYYGVSGSGLVMHTCNPRLHPEQLAYIINHAEDEVVFFDSTFAPLIKAIASHCSKVKHWICLSDQANTPQVDGVVIQNYEDFIAPHSAVFAWPELDEKSGAALCYTSGTTGNPKGVLYSHRAITLSALSACLPNVLTISSQETVLPVVPMFHINAWCLPYACVIAGAKLVLPGPKLDGASLYELMEAEKVTISAGVPTIWMGLIAHCEQHNLRFSTMRRTGVGGSAMPKALIAKFNDVYKVDVHHGWGMTETTAIATMSNISNHEMDWPVEEQHNLVAKQGKSVFGVELKIVDEEGNTLPRDGSTQGELMVRGQWIVEHYHKAEKTALVNGWFPTGDIATISPDGVMQIRDRTKDVIKSGGEWISSIDLENATIAHPHVAMAAVIGVKHPKWDERPLLLIVPKPEKSLEKQEVMDFLAERVAKWWVPDEVIFVESLPVGGTGKVQKNDLRVKYGSIFTE
jgi:3-(methylthio)propionyl---CoA ligase